MELQYIVDSMGKRTDVIIPIDKWNEIMVLHPKLRKLMGELNPKSNSVANFKGLLTNEEVEKFHKRKPSDFAGTLSKKEAEKMKKDIEELR